MCIILEKYTWKIAQLISLRGKRPFGLAPGSLIENVSQLLRRARSYATYYNLHKWIEKGAEVRKKQISLWKKRRDQTSAREA